ncbi:hypothetical protein HYS31_04105 [Candidatus Woesearchaeota archaeon]|nr:hypothetical protein [Candidatus Woesearchaeota archaeon]
MDTGQIIKIDKKFGARGLYYQTDAEYHDQNGIFDGEIPLTLWKDGAWLATACLNWGLDEYFDALFDVDWPKEWYIGQGYVKEDAFRQHETAALFARDLVGVVQMQAMPQTSRMRGGIPYHDILMEGLEKIAAKEKFQIKFFLPAELNRWISPHLIWENEWTNEHAKHFLEGLIRNYNKVAERHGFMYDGTSGLYLMA